ncbi:MAG: glycosyltransferase family 39 protein [Euryarchaeota archaeon]|nr:glycosyltransferase family 39 protein [Euryarchaeota archaeon]
MNKILFMLKRNYILIILFLIFLLALAIRLIPARYPYLIEADPYFHYRMIKNIVESGARPTFDILLWPQGIEITQLPILDWTFAIFYNILTCFRINITLLDFCRYFPAVLGAFSAVLFYLFAKELYNPQVGIFSSIFLAISPAFLTRTVAGFSDDESLAIVFIILTLFFSIRFLKKESILNLSMAGIFLLLSAMSWGTFVFLPIAFAFFALVQSFRKKISKELILFFAVIILVTFLALLHPHYRFLQLVIKIFLIGVFFFITFIYYFKVNDNWKLIGAVIIFVLISLVFLTLYKISLFSILQSIKFRPWLSAESLSPDIYTYLSLINFELFLLPFGLYIALKKLSDFGVFLLVLFLVSLFLAQEMVRFFFILAIPASVLSGLVIATLLSLKGKIVKIFNITLASLVMIIGSHAAVSLGNQIEPLMNTEWYDALIWLNKNTPNDSVVMAWWWYGYWIEAIAERKALIDGGRGTFDTLTLISNFYCASDEKEAITLAKRLGVNYVLVSPYSEKIDFAQMMSISKVQNTNQIILARLMRDDKNLEYLKKIFDNGFVKIYIVNYLLVPREAF